MFLWPMTVAVVAGVVLIALGAGSSVPGMIAYTFSAFVLATIALEFAKGTAARRALSNESWPAAFAQLMARNRRRYGGYVVHVAIVLLAIGVAGSSAYDKVVDAAKVRPGDTVEVGDYALTYRSFEERDTDHHGEVRGVFDVTRGGTSLGTLDAGKNVYPIANQPAQVSSEVGLRTDYLRAEDLFLIVQNVEEDGTLAIRVFVKPLVNLIWLAGLVFLLGSVIALWPDAREERRLATRYARALGRAPVRGG
jgi:cytochrome c-type biogenesis protein CcmF